MEFFKRRKRASEYAAGELVPVGGGRMEEHIRIDMDEQTKQELKREVREMLAEKIDRMLQDMITPAIEARLREMLKASRREGADALAGQIMAELFKREGN